MGVIANKLAVLRSKRLHIEAKMRALEESCPHPGYTIGWWSWRVGVMDPMRICNECWSNLGAPSQAEEDAFREAETMKRKRLGLGESP